MVRNIDSTALAQLQTEKGTEPLNYIEIAWQDGTVTRYGDKDLPGINGKILNMTDLDEIINLDNSGGSGSISLTLDDTDGNIKSLMDQYVIHKRPCTVYQYFQDMPISSAFPILYGEIVSPIEWTEASRQVTLTVATKIFSNEVGFAIEEGQFVNIRPELVGVVWPLGFGGVVHSPAVLIGSVLSGTNMTLFGVPDYTLPLKQNMIYNSISDLVDAFDQYVEFANNIRVSIPMPLETQQNYINLIKSEDGLKQKREDETADLEILNKQIDALIEEYVSTDANDTDELDDIRDRINIIKTTRSKIEKKIRDYTDELSSIEFDKKASEIDGENEKYVYGVIGSIRKKLGQLLVDYGRLNQELADIQNAILLNNQFLQSQVIIANGEYFPQNVPIIIDFNGMKVLGVMVNRLFTIQNFIPTYQNIGIGPKIDTKMDTFYITDPTLTLQDKYCRLNNGGIIKVSNQTGNKCTFELKTVSKSRRAQRREIEYTGANASTINSGLSNILTGYESQEYIEKIINTFPTDISQEAWYNLIGQNNQQRIKMEGDCTGGTFTLYFDGLESDPLKYNATAQEVEDTLNLMDVIIHSPDVQNTFTVTGGPLTDSNGDHHEIIIEWSRRPMVTLRADGTNLVSAIQIKVDDDADNGDFVIGFSVSYNPNSTTSSNIPNIPNCNCGYGVSAANLNSFYSQYSQLISFSGGPANDKPIVVTINDPSINCYLVENNVVDSDNKEVLVTVGPPSGDRAFVTCYTYSTGAHEHTTREIETMLKNFVGRGEFGKALKNSKKALMEAIAEYRDTPYTNADDLKVRQKALFETAEEYWKVAKQISYSPSIMDKAYAPISKHEYQKLFEMEVYHYLEFIRSITPLPTSTEDQESYYINGFDVTNIGIAEVCPTILPGWLGQFNYADPFQLEHGLNALPGSQNWIAQVSDTCHLDGAYQEKYAVNIVPSSIKAVYAYKTIEGVKRFVPLPTRYYIKNESDNYGIFQATTISLYKPLSEYREENWEDGIYVTFDSSLSGNTAETIDYIVTNYTNLSMDSTSYNHVKSVLANYPQNFVLTEKWNAFDLIKEIAWQARCLAFIKGTKVFLKYLSEEPNSVQTITESDILFDSLRIGYTETEDVSTKFVATWKPSYNYDKPIQIILRHNISRYGLTTDTHDYFTYNIGDLVMKSSTFWMIRRANTWKLVRFKTGLNMLHLEIHDEVTLDVEGNFFSNGPIKGIVNKATYNSTDNSIDFEVWLPIRMGEMDQYEFAWPANISSSVIFPKAEDIASGYAGIPGNSGVPSGSPYDPYDPSLVNFRPKDYGSIHLSDQSDDAPNNPSQSFHEIDYENATSATPSASPAAQLSDDRDLEKESGAVAGLDTDGIGSSHEDSLGPMQSFNKFNPSFMGMGRVVSFDSEKSVEVAELPDGSDPDVNVIPQFYNVRLGDGRVVSVRQMQISSSERIPKGTVTQIMYDPHLKEFQMQVPIWLWPEDIA